MKVENFDIEFKVKSTKQKANCQRFQVHNYPQIRVAVDRGEKRADVFTFYDVNSEKHRFFWYTLKGHREEFAKVIVKKLEKVFG